MRTMFGILAAVLAAPALASPTQVETFELATWEQLREHAPRPSAIVFTATYCANCPAVVASLADALKQKGHKSEVLAVVIDETDDRSLLASDHYTHASRLFRFIGNETALRYRVDPRWRGVTPYVALIDQQGAVTFVTGAPDDEDVAGWLAAGE